jgi:UDP-N-acetylmuramoyl-tripeptide--D-alanyl-D-alanine ligase
MTAPFSANDVVRWTGGNLVAGNPQTLFTAAVIDSRQVSDGHLFTAIEGPHHDAHRFVPQVLAAGAAGVLVRRGSAVPADSACVIEVDDTLAALAAVAAGHRALFEGPVVAITGSSGKTTTKEMCAAILSADGPCLKTQGNLNNEFGLPLTLLRREAQHQRLVVELGMNHRGEIARLAAIAKPSIALVTNCGVAHIEFLGSVEAIAEEKGDLYASLGPNGVAIANLDDPLASAQARRFKGRVIEYACGRRGDVRALNPQFVDGEAFAFELETPDGQACLRVAGLGETTVTNAAGAAAAALAAGVGLEAIVTGLGAYRPPPGRMTRYPIADGATLIDDSYNANPASMQTSLQALSALAISARAIAVVGDMGELGKAGDDAHRETGRIAAKLGIDWLIAIGERAPRVIEGAREAGMPPARSLVASGTDTAIRLVRECLQKNDWVLIKGSRAMKLERVVEALRGRTK